MAAPTIVRSRIKPEVGARVTQFTKSQDSPGVTQGTVVSDLARVHR